MSSEHEPDDRELEEWIEGRSPLSSAYREASRDAAPPELDAPILAAAKEAVRQPAPRAARRPAWLRPLAFAATFVLSLSVLLSVWREPELRQQVVPGDEVGPASPVPIEAEVQSGVAPAPMTVPPVSADAPLQDAITEHKADAALAKKKAEDTSRANLDESMKAQESERRYRFYRDLEQGESIGTTDDRAASEAATAARSELPKSVAPAPAKPEAPPPSQPEPLQESVTGGFAAEPPPAAASAPPPPTAAPAESDATSRRYAPMMQNTPAASREDASQDLRPALNRAEAREVQDWVTRIRALRDRGDLEGARRELEALRKAYPAFEVPLDLKRLQPE